MFLEIFDLNHDLIRVASLLICENLKFVLCISLHENVVLVEDLDRLVDLQNLASLHILKVDLPLLRFLAQGVDLALEVRDLVLGILLKSAHDFLDTGDLLGECLVGETSVLDRLLLQSVHFGNLILQR